MHRLPVVVEALFRYNIMDKTLADYIKRISNLEEQLKSPQPASTENNNDYLVYPEPNSIDSDEKRNPYSKV